VLFRSIVKEESCSVIVRNIPDGISARDEIILRTALKAQGKDWEEDSLHLVGARESHGDDDHPEVSFKAAAE
jgi:hypothetical protein